MARKTFKIIEGKRLRKGPKTKLKLRNKKTKPVEIKQVPSIRKCLHFTLKQIWQNKKIFFSIVIIYLILNLLFVKGFSNSVDISAVRQQINSSISDNNFLENVILSGYVATSSSSSQQDAVAVYQSIILVIIILAYIWLFRAISAPNAKKIFIRQPFYESMAPLIPFLFVLLIIGLQLIPMFIGLSIYSTVQASGLAVTITENILWATFALFFVFVSFYMLASTFFALIIVTLPNETPIQSIKSAFKVTKFRRFVVMRRLIGLGIIIFISISSFLLFAVSFVPVLAELSLMLAGAFAIPVFIGTTYKMYREIL